jgi:arylsulfatase A-like enzyme/Flp pilus assembly protein TadD
MHMPFLFARFAPHPGASFFLINGKAIPQGSVFGFNKMDLSNNLLPGYFIKTKRNNNVAVLFRRMFVILRGMGRRRVSIILSIAWISLASCAPTETALPVDPNQRDVLLVTIDTWRYDASGFSGSGKVRTPALDRLADGGRVFDFAHAHAVVTLPSHASILTGRFPYEHGVHDNAGYRLDGSIPTLASMLRAQGWATAAFVSAFPLDRRYGLAQGFDRYDDEYDGFAPLSFTPPERPAGETVEKALEWWEAQRGKPRLMWVHIFTPHYPYEPGPPWEREYAAAPYYGDVARSDSEIAPLIERVLDGPDGNTVVIVTSDHGEALGEHGEQTHGMFAYEATLKVPLVLYARGAVKPSRDDRSARHVDIVPTVLELTGIEGPTDLPGQSLVGAWEDDPPSYFEALSPWVNRGWAPLHGTISAGHKAIRLPLAELYDLRQDPSEQDNLVSDKNIEYRRFLLDVPDPSVADGERETLDAETIKRLRSLGYATANATRPPEFGPELDPKNLILYDDMLASALSSFRDDKTDVAIAWLRRIIDEQPLMGLAYSHLAFFYSDLGRGDEAIRVLESAVQNGASNESIRRKLALALVRANRLDDAHRVLIVDTESTDPETQSALGRVASRQGRYDDAMSRFQRALQLDSSFPTASMDSGILLMEMGRFDEARPLLERALEQDPFLAEAWNALGVIESSVQRPQAAIDAWKRAVDADPRMVDALYNLGLMLGRTGDREGALAVLKRYAPLVQGDLRREANAMLKQLESAGNP